MATPYDYVQIVVDDGWGLVGIVPPGFAGDKVKQLSINTTVSEDITPQKSAPNLPEVVKLPQSEPATSRPIPVISRPKPKIITRHDAVPQITPAEQSVPISKPVKANALSGIAIEEATNRQVFSSPYEQRSELLGNLSGLSRARNNLLVGFGK